MRTLRFLTAPPWWTGRPSYFVGAAIVVQWYAISVIVALFGAWTFSKLMPSSDYKELACAVIGLPLFFASMFIPASFDIETPVLAFFNDLSTTATCAMRSALGLASGFIAFKSFR